MDWEHNLICAADEYLVILVGAGGNQMKFKIEDNGRKLSMTLTDGDSATAMAMAALFFGEKPPVAQMVWTVRPPLVIESDEDCQPADDFEPESTPVPKPTPEPVAKAVEDLPAVKDLVVKQV